MGLDITMYKVLDRDIAYCNTTDVLRGEHILKTLDAKNKAKISYSKDFDQIKILKRAKCKINDLELRGLPTESNHSLLVINNKLIKFYENKCKRLHSWRLTKKYSKMRIKHSEPFRIPMRDTCRNKRYTFNIIETGYLRGGMKPEFYKYYGNKKLYFLYTKEQVLKLQTFVDAKIWDAEDAIELMVNTFKEGEYFIHLSW